jgi:hypothetical protein
LIPNFMNSMSPLPTLVSELQPRYMMTTKPSPCS